MHPGKSLLALLVALHVNVPAWALEPVRAGTRGELDISIEWNSRIVARGEFADLTVIKRSTTITCPVVAGDVSASSAIDGATPEQDAATAQMGRAASAQLNAIDQDSVTQMKSLERRMRDCRKAGGSEQACGMQMMAAMQADPALIDSMGAMGADESGAMARADRAVAAAAGAFQPWWNEGCRGQMTVADSRKLDDPTLPGEEPTVHTTGTRPINTRDTLVTVDTDLAKGHTRYLLVTAEATGFQQEAGNGNQARLVSASAMPNAVVIAGPFPGSVRNGSHEFNTTGGKVRIVWTFRRLAATGLAD